MEKKVWRIEGDFLIEEVCTRVKKRRYQCLTMAFERMICLDDKVFPIGSPSEIAACFRQRCHVNYLSNARSHPLFKSAIQSEVNRQGNKESIRRRNVDPSDETQNKPERTRLLRLARGHRSYFPLRTLFNEISTTILSLLLSSSRLIAIV